jgi:peptidyl-prolyl cis-trans isomerase SurA
MTRLFFRSSWGMLLLTITLALCSSAVTAKVQDVDRIVAVVDDEVIVNSELQEKLSQIVAQLKAKKAKLPPKKVLERQVLERLIINKIQISAAARSGINVSEDILAQAVSNIARKNRMSLSEFRSAVERSGLSFNAFRNQLRNQITTQRFMTKEMRSRVHVTEREIDAYIANAKEVVQTPKKARKTRKTAFHLFHILIATPEGASSSEIQSAKRKAQKLVKKLRAGADFQNIALAESDGQQALEGGDLGWRSRSQLPSIFAKVVPKMGRGAISDPIRTSSGFHIVKVANYKGGNVIKEKTKSPIFEQTKARHILIRTSEITSDNDAKTRLEQLKQRLDGGDDFAALARSHSDDQASSIKGGELGWINPGDVVPEFEQQMKQLQTNEISAPFKTQYGWHIVQVLERRMHDSSGDIKRSQAREAIFRRKATEESQLFLRRLRDEAYVEIHLEDESY